MLFVWIIDILLEVDVVVGFLDVFFYFRIGVLCSDWVGLLNVLFVEGLNLGF